MAAPNPSQFQSPIYVYNNEQPTHPRMNNPPMIYTLPLNGNPGAYGNTSMNRAFTSIPGNGGIPCVATNVPSGASYGNQGFSRANVPVNYHNNGNAAITYVNDDGIRFVLNDRERVNPNMNHSNSNLLKQEQDISVKSSCSSEPASSAPPSPSIPKAHKIPMVKISGGKMTAFLGNPPDSSAKDISKHFKHILNEDYIEKTQNWSSYINGNMEVLLPGEGVDESFGIDRALLASYSGLIHQILIENPSKFSVQFPECSAAAIAALVELLYCGQTEVNDEMVVKEVKALMKELQIGGTGSLTVKDMVKVKHEIIDLEEESLNDSTSTKQIRCEDSKSDSSTGVDSSRDDSEVKHDSTQLDPKCLDQMRRAEKLKALRKSKVVFVDVQGTGKKQIGEISSTSKEGNAVCIIYGNDPREVAKNIESGKIVAKPSSFRLIESPKLQSRAAVSTPPLENQLNQRPATPDTEVDSGPPKLSPMVPIPTPLSSGRGQKRKRFQKGLLGTRDEAIVTRTRVSQSRSSGSEEYDNDNNNLYKVEHVEQRVHRP